MKHTHSFFSDFQDKEHRLIHLLEDSNPPLPAIEGDGPEQKESTDKPKTEKIDAQSTSEDVNSVGETALADAEKGSTDLQGELKKAQEDVNRIRLAAALGSGGLSAEEEHSAAEQRLAEAQMAGLAEDHNPMSGGEVPLREIHLEMGIADSAGDVAVTETPAAAVTETHEQKPDTINEVEGVLEDVSETTDHVTEKVVQGGGGDGAGGTPDAPKDDDIEGDGSDPNLNDGSPSVETTDKPTDSPDTEETVESTGDIKTDLKKAFNLMKSNDDRERDKGVVLFLETIMNWLDGKFGNGKGVDAKTSTENASTENMAEKGSEATSEQNDVVHGPARRARLMNAYRTEQKKQPGITATEFIAIKEDSIQKDEKSLTEAKDDLSKEEKNLKDRLDILKAKRDKEDPKKRGPLDAEITETETELKSVEKKALENKDALDKLTDRKNDIVVLKELRDKLKTLQDALKELPKDVLDNLNDAQRDVLNAFIKGIDAETYTVNFPTDEQINQLPTNAQDVIRNSTFYTQKEVYRSQDK